MEVTTEFYIFLVVALIAIVAAVRMLTSDNAVHSALWLVLNFACVAFLFLMLQAAFLAMVQVAVYAGAIMVLFMFVIMLLGGERMLPEEKPRFPWLGYAAPVLGMVLLIVAGVGVLSSDISAEEPEPQAPMVRVINVLPGYETVAVQLNDVAVTSGLEFRAESDLLEVPAGEYNITITAQGGEKATGRAVTAPIALLHYNDPAAEMNLIEEINAKVEGTSLTPSVERLAPTLELADNSYITLVLTLLEDGAWGVIPVQEDLNTMDFSSGSNIQVVNAATEAGTIDFANIQQDDRSPQVLFESVLFGQASSIEDPRAGVFQHAIYDAGLIAQTKAATPPDKDFVVGSVVPIAEAAEMDFTSNTSTLYVVASPLRDLPGQHPELLHYTSDNLPAFGSPTNVGRLLFTDYMLPFQVIALLLLVAMIGAIVLTRDQVAPPRKRFPRRLASTGAPVVGEEE